MLKRSQNYAILCLLFFLLSGSLFSQELNSTPSKYDDILKISPLSFDLTELAEMELSEIRNIAYQAMLENDFSRAAKFYLYVISHDIDDAHSHYNLARCYGYLGQSNYASNFLIMAINYGFNNYTLIKADEAFKSLKQQPEFYKQFQVVLDSGKDLGENIYVETEKLVKCRVLLPENYDAELTYPLLIGMHGYGGRPEEFARLWEALQTHSFIFVIPEGPYDAFPDTYNKVVGYSWDVAVRDLELYKRSDHFSSEFIVNVKDYVSKNYSIGKSFLLGFSQGGGHAYATGIKNVDKFEGIICFGARLPDYKKYPWFLSEDEIRAGKDLKVFIAHGKEDGNPNKSAVAAKKILRKFDYEVKLQLFEGRHYVNIAALEAALKWMEIQ